MLLLLNYHGVPLSPSSHFSYQAESEASLAEMWGLRERQGVSERGAEGLKEELCALVAQRDQGQTELHQARLQAAQLTLQLADASLALREGRAHWAQERQSLQCSTEVMTRIIVWMDLITLIGLLK